MVMGYSDGNSGLAMERAMTAANEFCLTQGKLFILRHERSQATSAQLLFSCVTEDDPEYKRPDLHQDPSVVVENH